MGREPQGSALFQSPARLARGPGALTFSALARRVRAHLGQDHRYEHCVRVARLAELLAMRHAVGASQARLAGMLHDLARLYEPRRLLKEARQRGLAVDDYAARHPIVLHASLSAELARDLFGVEDPAVLSAIRKHTTGDATMSRLDCVLYLADSLEPGRSFPQRAGLLQTAFEDLDAAMRSTLAESFVFLREKGLAAAPQTIQAAGAFGL